MANNTTRKHSAEASSRRDRRRFQTRRTSGSTSSQTSSHPSSPAFRSPAASAPGAAPHPAAALRRFRARLASARDRQRLGERNQQERDRVEKMLATAPLPLDSAAEMPIESSVAWDSPRELGPDRELFWHLDSQPESYPTSHPESPRGWVPQGCPVCGGTRVACDEVMQLGTLRLSECFRCEHRWTERGPERWAEVGAPMKRSARRTSRTRPTQA